MGNPYEDYSVVLFFKSGPVEIPMKLAPRKNFFFERNSGGSPDIADVVDTIRVVYPDFRSGETSYLHTARNERAVYDEWRFRDAEGVPEYEDEDPHFSYGDEYTGPLICRVYHDDFNSVVQQTVSVSELENTVLEIINEGFKYSDSY